MRDAIASPESLSLAVDVCGFNALDLVVTVRETTRGDRLAEPPRMETYASVTNRLRYTYNRLMSGATTLFVLQSVGRARK